MPKWAGSKPYHVRTPSNRLRQGRLPCDPYLLHSAGVSVLQTMPGGKLGQPAQVAEAAVWLCSDRADWVSGLSMIVDGGGVNR